METSPIQQLPDRPGTLNALKRLGTAIRDNDAETSASLHYNDVWAWYNDLVAAAIEEIAGLGLESLAGAPVAVTGRAKVRETVRDKLRRRPADKLPSIQDLAGVRIEADTTLGAQDAIANALATHFGADERALHDLRHGRHAGYRGLHVWVRLQQPRGAWFEVQVRTMLQGEWANTYEALADLVGREIRYGVLPSDPGEREAVKMLQEVSVTSIANAERAEDLLRQWKSGHVPTNDLTAGLEALGIAGTDSATHALTSNGDALNATLAAMDDARRGVLELLGRAQQQIRLLSKDRR